MSKQSNLVKVLSKVFPYVKGKDLYIRTEKLEVKVQKKSFLETLLIKYRNLVEGEIERDKNIEFDTDFSGCYQSGYGTFKIQDKYPYTNSTVFEFILWYPKEEESDEEPETVEFEFNWEETKAWSEYLLCSTGYEKEVFTMREEMTKEKRELERESEKDRKKVSTEVEGISIFPNGSIDYHSVWVSNEEGDMIPILVNELDAIADFMSDEGNSDLKVENVYTDGEHLLFSWDEEGTSITIDFVTSETIDFVTEKHINSVTLSSKGIKKLKKEIEKIDRYSYLI